MGTGVFSRGDWPPRSRIRGLAPIGVGTGWVEAASGLLVRTAAANHHTVRPLLERVLADAAGDASRPGESPEEIAALGRDLVRQPGASVNGGWGTAHAVVRILGAATLQPDLAQTTVIAWGDYLQKRGLLHEHRAVCSACLYDWTVDGRELYEPLRWQFQALEACAVHEVRLRTACATPGCGRVRGVVAGWASISRCVGCRRPFAQSVDDVREAEEPLSERDLDWARFVDAELSDILARPAGPDEPAGAPFADILAVALETVTGGHQKAFADRIGMTEASVSYWKDGRRTPTLTAMLRVCRVAGFRLRDVLLGDLAAIRASVPPAEPPYVSPSIEVHRTLDPDDMASILAAAMIAEPPPTLASIYADARIDRTHLRRRFPRQCAAIRERHRVWLMNERDVVRADRIKQIVDAVAALTDLGIYPSRNQVAKLVPGRWLRRPEFARAWREAVIAHGWGDPSRLQRIKGSATPTPCRVARETGQVRVSNRGEPAGS